MPLVMNSGYELSEVTNWQIKFIFQQITYLCIQQRNNKFDIQFWKDKFTLTSSTLHSVKVMDSQYNIVVKSQAHYCPSSMHLFIHNRIVNLLTKNVLGQDNKAHLLFVTSYLRKRDRNNGLLGLSIYIDIALLCSIYSDVIDVGWVPIHLTHNF